MENEEASINLTLKISQVNVLLGALGETPFRVAQPLIAAIQEQAAPQLQPAEEVAETKVVKDK